MINNTVTYPRKTSGLVSAPVSSHKTGPSSPGTYNGVAINPGTDEEVAKQVQGINASLAAKQTPVKGLLSTRFSPTSPASDLVQTPTPAPAPAPQQPSTPSYADRVGSLANASNPNATQTGLIKQGVDAASGNTSIGTQAKSIQDYYQKQIEGLAPSYQQMNAELTTGTAPVGEGNAAITYNAISNRLGNLKDAENAALQGIGYQLTGQGQLQSGLNNALGAANTQQGQQITGLNEAAGYAQPQRGTIGDVTYNPINQGNGQILGSDHSGDIPTAGYLRGAFQGAEAVGAAPYNVQAQNLTALGTAQTAGQAAGIQAQAAAPGLGQAAGTQAQSAAPGQTAAQNYVTAGTAQTTGEAAGTQAAAAAAGQTQAGQYGQIAAYKSAAQQGEQLASQLNDLLTKFKLNPSDFNAYNSGLQKIAANTSDPRYQVLSNYLNDVASRYAQVLTPPGGSATDMTRSIAASMLNATASGKSIKQVLGSLGQQAQAVISAVPATGTVPGANSQYKNGQTTSSGGHNFVFSNGKWVAK